jgi:putative addiction module component (TIGR02574 family)
LAAIDGIVTTIIGGGQQPLLGGNVLGLHLQQGRGSRKRSTLRDLTPCPLSSEAGEGEEQQELGKIGKGGSTVSKAELIHEIRRLPFAERVELLEELWREAENEHPELLDWQKELLDQRLRDAEAHPEDWVSWDEAKQRLERQLHSH